MKHSQVIGKKQVTHSKIRDRRILLRKILLILILSGLAYGGIYLCSNPRFAITNVVATGTVKVSNLALVSDIEQELGGWYGYVLPRANIYTYPKAGIIDRIYKQYPKVANVDISVQDNILNLKISEYDEDLILCSRIVAESALGKCYLVSPTGESIDTIDFSIVTPRPYIISNKTFGNKLDLGRQVISASTIEGVKYLITELSRQGIEARSIELAPRFNKIQMAEGWYLVYDNEQALDVVVRNLGIAIGSEAVMALGTSKLSYIDLTFANKIFYKFVDENEPR